jgi:hypothetical protein
VTPSEFTEDQPFFDVLEEEHEDNATVDAQSSRPPLSVQEYITYSASFNVPAFYFTMHNTSLFFAKPVQFGPSHTLQMARHSPLMASFRPHSSS